MATKSKCITSHCRGPKQRGNYCYKCVRSKDKERDPVLYTLGILRRNARRRSVYFDLSIEYFRKFCEETKYIELKGKKGFSLSIDRIDPSKGYIEGNIQVLSLAGNSRKRFVDYYIMNPELLPPSNSAISKVLKEIQTNETAPF